MLIERGAIVGSYRDPRLRAPHPSALRTIELVAYDEELAGRIRERLGDDAGVAERKMFGGLAFLVGGNMAVAASGQGGLLIRVDPAESAQLVAETNRARWRCAAGRCRGGCGSTRTTCGPRRRLRDGSSSV